VSRVLLVAYNTKKTASETGGSFRDPASRHHAASISAPRIAISRSARERPS
jgi:hypothetical protein